MPILRLFIEVLPLLLFGYLIGHFNRGVSSQIVSSLVNYGIPLSISGLLLKSGLDRRLFESLVIAMFTVVALIIVIRIIPSLKSRIGSRSLLLGSVFGNSGYFGIPVSLALLPTDALSFSIGYDLGATLLIWSLGPVLLAKSSDIYKDPVAWKNLLDVFRTSPAIKGLIGALLLKITPWSEQLTSLLWIPSKIVIVCALLIVGMRLSSLNYFNGFDNKNLFLVIQPCLVLKLFILPSFMLLISTIFSFSSLMAKALILQAGAPTAISVLLLAEANGIEVQESTLLVAISTLAAFITIPTWYFLLN